MRENNNSNNNNNHNENKETAPNKDKIDRH